MKTRQFSTTLVLLLVWPLGAMQNTTPTPLTSGSATITELKGKISIQSPQGPIANAQRGTVLLPGTTLEVEKGSILLDLEDASQILIKAHSRVVLRSPNESKGYWLELLLGRIVAKVKKRLGEAPPFRMGTPTAVITVRGTRFSVEVTKKQRTFVEVFEGLVQVEGFGPQSRGVLVRPGFSTGINLGREPDEPRQQGVFGEDAGRTGSEDQGSRIGSPRDDARPTSSNQPGQAPGGESEREHN